MISSLAKLPQQNVVMIDNYDSFVYNLVQYLQQLGLDVTTLRNDACKVSEILEKKPDWVILSPGPSEPEQAGICLELVRACQKNRIPLFGVCLGHQSIAQAFGGRIRRCALPMHGKTSAIQHDAKGVFADMPDNFQATRYHSLEIDPDSLPDCLDITAKSADGCIQGIKHRDWLCEGVQFHPEAVLTEYGHRMLANFARQV